MPTGRRECLADVPALPFAPTRRFLSPQPKQSIPTSEDLKHVGGMKLGARTASYGAQRGLVQRQKEQLRDARDDADYADYNMQPSPRLIRREGHAPVSSTARTDQTCNICGVSVGSARSLPFHKKKCVQKRFETECAKLLGNMRLDSSKQADIHAKLIELQETLEGTGVIALADQHGPGGREGGRRGGSGDGGGGGGASPPASR